MVCWRLISYSISIVAQTLVCMCQTVDNCSCSKFGKMKGGKGFRDEDQLYYSTQILLIDAVEKREWHTTIGCWRFGFALEMVLVSC